MKHKMLTCMIATTMSLGMMSACSSDAKSPVTTKAPASGDTTAPATGSGAADKFCAETKDLTVKLKAMIANPAGADAAALTASATKLSTDAAALISANPADSAKIQACGKEMSAALTGG